MLLKAYIWQKKWTEAEKIAKEIIDSKDYELEPDFEFIWTLDGEHSSGSIMEVEAIWIPGATSSTLGLRISDQQGYKLGFNNPTQDLVDEFEPNDPRLNASIIQKGVNDTIAQVYDEYGNLITLTYAKQAKSETGYWCKKYVTPYDIASVTWSKNMPQNIRLMRYADVLLMHAEAAYHKNHEDDARASLELVRKRARGGNESILPKVTASGTELLDAIYHERRVELSLEGHRYYDVVRQGRGEELFGDRGFKTGVHEYLPIPQYQIELSYGALKPNAYQ